MPLQFTNAEKVKTLQFVTNNAVPEDLELHLFQNDVTPDGTTVIGGLTEATFSGYASVELVPATWGFTTASTAVALYGAAVNFTSDADSQNQPIYGYYITGATSGDLKYAERFANGPYTIVNNGDNIAVTPRITNVNAGA